MFLYHYSDAQYENLKTRKAQGVKLPKKDMDEQKKFNEMTNSEGYYDEHISLFFDPIPLDLPQIFHHRHPFWVAGKELYEYVVDADKLEHDVMFKVSESPENTNFIILYKEMLRNKSDKLALDDVDDYGYITEHVRRYREAVSVNLDDDEVFYEYLRQRNKMLTDTGQRGRSRDLLNKNISRYRGHIRGYYLNSYKMFENDEPNLVKYAACVPHVQIYPTGGIIKQKYVNKIKLDGSSRPATESLLDRW